MANALSTIFFELTDSISAHPFISVLLITGYVLFIYILAKFFIEEVRFGSDKGWYGIYGIGSVLGFSITFLLFIPYFIDCILASIFCFFIMTVFYFVISFVVTLLMIALVIFALRGIFIVVGLPYKKLNRIRAMLCELLCQLYGHNWDEWMYQAPNSCIQVRTCKRSKRSDVKHFETHIVHDWGEWEYEDYKNCTQVQICRRDGARSSFKRTLHDWGEWTYECPNQCVLVRFCSRCPAKETKTAQHDWGDWEFKAQNSCDFVRKCRHCPAMDSKQSTHQKIIDCHCSRCGQEVHDWIEIGSEYEVEMVDFYTDAEVRYSIWECTKCPEKTRRRVGETNRHIVWDKDL